MSTAEDKRCRTHRFLSPMLFLPCLVAGGISPTSETFPGQEGHCQICTCNHFIQHLSVEEIRSLSFSRYGSSGYNATHFSDSTELWYNMLVCLRRIFPLREVPLGVYFARLFPDGVCFAPPSSSRKRVFFGGLFHLSQTFQP